MPIPIALQSIVKAPRPTVVAFGLGVFLTTAAFLVLVVFRIQANAASRSISQYRAATENLAQLTRDRNRITRELAQSRRLINWNEAQLKDARELTAEPLDDDVAQLCKVTITEQEMSLSRTCRRRAQLVAQKSQIERKIAALQVVIRQMDIPGGPVSELLKKEQSNATSVTSTVD